jgi:hypothetical protein
LTQEYLKELRVAAEARAARRRRWVKLWPLLILVLAVGLFIALRHERGPARHGGIAPAPAVTAAATAARTAA